MFAKLQLDTMTVHKWALIFCFLSCKWQSLFYSSVVHRKQNSVSSKYTQRVGLVCDLSNCAAKLQAWIQSHEGFWCCHLCSLSGKKKIIWGKWMFREQSVTVGSNARNNAWAGLRRDACRGSRSKQCSTPALKKSTDQQVKGTSSVLIYLNPPAEDQYQILIPVRE